MIDESYFHNLDSLSSFLHTFMLLYNSCYKEELAFFFSHLIFFHAAIPFFFLILCILFICFFFILATMMDPQPYFCRVFSCVKFRNQFLLSHFGLWNKNLNGLFFLLNMESPRVQKVSHWLSEDCHTSASILPYFSTVWEDLRLCIATAHLRSPSAAPPLPVH